MNSVQEATRSFDRDDVKVRFRRFGPFGPAYEILELGGKTSRVKVAESGEEFDYPTHQLLDDPEA